MGSAASTTTAPAATLLICHSSQERTLRELLAAAVAKCDPPREDLAANQVVVVTELFPRDLQTRAELLLSCQCAIVGVDPHFQTSTTLIDTLSFLKDTRRRVVAGPLTFFTRPSGAVGAICTAFGSWDAQLFDDTALLAAQLTSSVGSGGCKLLVHSELEEIFTRDRAADAQLDQIQQHDQQIYEAAHTAHDASVPSHMLYVSSDADGQRIAQQFDGLTSTGMQLTGTWSFSNSPSTSSSSSELLDADLHTVATCRVVAFIITADCVSNPHFRRLFEAALRWKKPFLPINAGIRLSGWLQLAMAGRLWYQVDLDHLEYLHTPYAEVPNCPCRMGDACLAADFLACANGLLTADAHAGVLEATLIETRELAALQAAREEALVQGVSEPQIQELTSRIQELISAIDSGATPPTALETLGIATSAEAIDAQRVAAQLVYPSATELLPEKPEIELHHQHYTVTRQALSLPPSILDAHGLPILNMQLDAMFSYQWSSQETVLDVRQQGSVFNVRAWLDVFGHMQGNVNSAMAAAVETVACVVVFLTPKYIESINCKLEFQYAARCRKPFVLVYLCDPEQLILPVWMREVVGEDFNIYPTKVDVDKTTTDRVLALDYSAERVNGVPLTNVLFGAIRVLAAQRGKAPLAVAYDGSLLLYATTAALRHAILHPVAAVGDTAADGEGGGGGGAAAAAAKIECSRCGVAFHPSVASSMDGCRKHGAYYVGGNIIAGRWVCCQETKKDGVGCQPADHIQEPRAWTCDPAYGTYSWKPE